MILRRLSLQFAFVLLISVSVSSAAKADLLQFSWIDDQGDAGHFIWDPSQGYSVTAISEFVYILFDGSPTPPGFIPNSFTTFNNGFSWDMNTGPEGVDFTFTTAFTPPLPNDPNEYEQAFDSGNFITMSNTRVWDDLVVTTVPEPCSSFILILGSCPMLMRRRANGDRRV